MNKVMLEGKCGKDAEVRYDKQGNPISKISLATSNDYKDKNGEWVKRPASWHNIVAFGKNAEVLAAYKKGQSLKLEGKLSYNEWVDKSGSKRITAEILVSFFDSKTESEKHDSGRFDDPPF